MTEVKCEGCASREIKATEKDWVVGVKLGNKLGGFFRQCIWVHILGKI